MLKSKKYACVCAKNPRSFPRNKLALGTVTGFRAASGLGSVWLRSTVASPCLKIGPRTLRFSRWMCFCSCLFSPVTHLQAQQTNPPKLGALWSVLEGDPSVPGQSCLLGAGQGSGEKPTVIPFPACARCTFLYAWTFHQNACWLLLEMLEFSRMPSDSTECSHQILFIG